MKRVLIYLAIIFGASFLLSNAAQPGVWNAGGSGSFQLLFPKDSLAYKKIQMKSEKIYMQLYNGYAVVKGVYNFYNTTEKPLSIKVGYPINEVFNSQHSIYKNEVRIDDLHKIKGLVNNQELPLYQKTSSQDFTDWYVWEVQYPPKKITTFTVYFLVNTNNARIIKGYDRDSRNAFIYLIETGSIWKSPIEEGEFYAQFKDNINFKTLKGTAPAPFQFNTDEAVLLFNMKDYGKKPDKNFIITYPKNETDFNFNKVVENSSSLFNEIDNFSNKNLSELPYKIVVLPNPYEVTNKEGSLIIGGFYFFVFYGIPIIIGVLVILLIVKIYKRFFKKKNS